ncbi:MAG: hypothetical protein Kow0091_10780 [Geminocystis sp.]
MSEILIEKIVDIPLRLKTYVMNKNPNLSANMGSNVKTTEIINQNNTYPEK